MECEDQDTQQRDPKTHEMYLNVMRRFSQALLKVQQLPVLLSVHKYGWKKRNRKDAKWRNKPLSFTPISAQGDKSVRVMRSLLAAQQTFVDRLVQLMKAVQRESGNRKKKVRARLPRAQQETGTMWRSRRNAAVSCASPQTERLQALLADNDKVYLSDIEPIPLPLEPQIRIRGIVPETATLFKVQDDVRESPSC